MYNLRRKNGRNWKTVSVSIQIFKYLFGNIVFLICVGACISVLKYEFFRGACRSKEKEIRIYGKGG